MEPEKKLGYGLLAVGTFLMLMSLLLAFLVYSGANSPPRLFEMQKPTGTMSLGGVEMPAFEIIPVDYLNQSGNLTFFLLFMFFVVSIGGRLSMMGIALIKETKKQGPI